MKYRPYILSTVSGLSMFFIFPNFLGINLWPLGFAALVPLLIGLGQARSARHAALIAGVGALAGYPLLYHWLVYTMNTYGNMSYPVSVFVLMGMVVLLSLFVAAFGLIYHLMVRGAALSPLLAAPLAWVAVELVRPRMPFAGFPWALLGYSQEPFLSLIQVSEITGPYGVSAIVMLTNACLAAAVTRAYPSLGTPPDVTAPPTGRRAMAVPLALAMGVPLAAALFGWVRMGMVDRAFEDRPEIKVGVVQANVDQGIKWSQDYFWKTLSDHLLLTEKVLKDDPRLVMWPEAAVTVGAFNEHWEYRTRVIRSLEAVDAYFLVGSLSKEKCGSGKCYFNSAYLLSPGAEKMLARYDKMRLVPFSEYVPLKKLFFFADAIASGNTGSTTPGEKVGLMPLPDGPFGCVICYEVIFPHLVRKFTNEGAAFMTTITNDAWFGKTGAPYQHHTAVVFRSVENRTYFVRSANTGISSIVDPNGRILKKTDIYVQASFTGVVKTTPFSTFYSRFGDVFGWLCLLFSLAAACYGAFASRKEKTPPEEASGSGSSSQV